MTYMISYLLLDRTEGEILYFRRKHNKNTSQVFI